MEDNKWQQRYTKSKFSQLVDKAINTPQPVTKHGINAVVVMPFEDDKKLTKPKNDLASLLRNSTLAEANIEITRSKDLPRDMEL